MSTINLQEYIEDISYKKSETWTQTEIIAKILYELSKLRLVEVVAELPTADSGTILENRLYLVLNNIAGEENLYDIYLYVNNRWEKLDSLEFNLNDYYSKSETNLLLAGKSDNEHIHDDATTNKAGFLSINDKVKLDNIEAGANKTILETSIKQNSNNPVTSAALYNSLNGKAPTDHSSTETTYGKSTASKYGHSKAGTSNPLMNGTANPGTDNGLYARADHVHPTDTSRASNSIATNEYPGLMSANDKAKLDNMDLSKYPTREEVEGLISAGGVTVDTAISSTSPNPVSNKAIYNALASKMDDSDFYTKINNLITEMNTLI